MERKIKNFEELATSDGRRLALEIAETGLWAIDTPSVVRRTVRLEDNVLSVRGETIPLDDVGRVLVCGAGKCAAEAAAALEEILGDRLAGGTVITPHEAPPLRRITAHRGTHPQPSDANIAGARALVRSLDGLNENDLVIFLVTGGGSTLLCLPDGGTGCREESLILRALTNVGATIQEINTVRKHLSLARGGFLAKHAYPARVVSLIFSDVPGNDAQFIASGPTIKDATSIADAEAVLEKYKVLDVCGIEKCGLLETPKEDKYFERVRNLIAVSNATALEAMFAKAAELGFRGHVCPDCLLGEARDVGVAVVQTLQAQAPKSALLYGGETTVTVFSDGKGGRNMELALSALRLVKDDQVIVTVASDGRDNTEFGGAIADRMTKTKMHEIGIEPGTYLDKNRSYDFFAQTGQYLSMGDTGSNVSDLLVAIRM